MKANLSKMLRSVLSLVLALSLVVGLCPAVFANELPELDLDFTVPTDDLSNIDWNSDLSDYDWSNVAWDKVDLSKIDYDKVPYDQVDYDKINYDQIDWSKINYDKVDYEKINYDKINYDQIDYEKIDYEKLDYDNIKWESVDINKIPLDQVPMDKVDINKIPLDKIDLGGTGLGANMSLTQIGALLMKSPSAAYGKLHDVLENRGYISDALTALDKLEIAVDAVLRRVENLEGAPAALVTTVKSAKGYLEQMRTLLSQDTIVRADLVEVFHNLRNDILTIGEMAEGSNLPQTIKTTIQDSITALKLAWKTFKNVRVVKYLGIIATATTKLSAKHREAIMDAAKRFVDVLVQYADILDPVLPEGIKAQAYELWDMLKSGQERKAITIAIAILDNTIEAVKESGAVNKQVAWQVLAKAQNLAITIKNAVYERYIEATRDYYTVTYGSHYVALGDASVVEDSYANLIAKELHMHYTNLGDENLVTAGETLLTIAENVDIIASADLITLGYDNNTFVVNALNGDLNFDWTSITNETVVKGVKAALATIENYLSNTLNIDVEQMNIILKGVEAYAYSAASYAWNAPKAVKAITEINPDAVVVLVGMYNPLQNMTIKIRNKTLDIGDYVNYVVAAAGIENLAYAMYTMDCIFVDARDVETEYEAAGKSTEFDAVAIFDYIATNGAEMRASDAGDEYIKTQILNALTIDYSGVYRLAGDTRFETAIEIAEEMKYLNNVDKFETMIITSGENFVDALAGSYLATTKSAPVLLSYLNDKTADRKYDNQTADYVAANLAANGVVYILGGEKAVSAEMEELLTSRGVDKNSIKRLAGADRFETNLAILNEMGVNGNEILVCTATVFADTLAASATGLPVLLVWNEKGELVEGKNYSQIEFLENLKGNPVTILGGPNAVSEELEAQIEEILNVEVDRVYGATRIETSVAVANKYFPNATQMTLATGWEFADALAGGVLASTLEAPIVLTMGAVSAEGYEYSKKWDYGTVINTTFTEPNGIRMGVVLGGTAEKCIPDALAKASFGLPADASIYVK